MYIYKYVFIHTLFMKDVNDIQIIKVVTIIYIHCSFSGIGAKLKAVRLNFMVSSWQSFVDRMDLIHYSFVPLILFRVPYMLDLLSVLSIDCKWRWGCRHF